MSFDKRRADCASSSDIRFPFDTLRDGAFPVGQRGRRPGVAIGHTILVVRGLETDGILSAGGDAPSVHGAAQGDGCQIGPYPCTGALLPALDDPNKG